MKSIISNGITIIDTEGVNGFRKNKSGYRGVVFIPSKNKYQAMIIFNRRSYHLGYFDNAEDAALIRIEAEKHRDNGTFHKWRSTLHGITKRKGCATK